MLYWTCTYISCSTKRGERTRQSLTCHIENVFEHQKTFSLQIKTRVNQRKMIQKNNSVLIRKKRMRIEGNQKNHELSRKLVCEITRGRAMKRRGCSAIFVENLRRQTPLHRQKAVQILEPQLCKDIWTVSLFLYYKDQVKKYVFVSLPVWM